MQIEKRKYIERVEANMQEEVEYLQELIRFNSEQDKPVKTADGEVYPFGKGVQDSLVSVLKKGEEMGFYSKNVENYGGHIDYGTGRKILGILGHLDVVPAGDGWSFPPYSGDVSDGFIYGRGTTDNKGPVVAALYAMKALKEAGYDPAARVRLVLGCDEETGWSGMIKYLELERTPDYGFTPDGDFPVINGEKGILTFDLVRKLPDRKLKGLTLRSLEGGAAANMVPEKARALVNSDTPAIYEKIKEQAEAFGSLYPEIRGMKPKITARLMGKSLEIAVEGKSAHGAMPHLGLNAISVLMEFLGQLNFALEEVNDVINFYNKCIGHDIYGERIGCQMEDEKSGPLTFNVGVATFEKKALTFTVNVRFPVTKTEEEVYAGMILATDQYDVGIVKGRCQKPIYFEQDSPMVKTFMEIYQENTGDMESKPLTIGGGTYARAMKNCLAFGALFPGDEDLMHQRDERLSLSRLELMTKIYADAIYRLTQEDFIVNGEPIGARPESGDEYADTDQEDDSDDVETEDTKENAADK